jgi:N,N'-diacetylchitobiose transport system substrate-binding protein
LPTRFLLRSSDTDGRGRSALEARRILAAGALVCGLGLCASVTGASAHPQAATSINVWLMADAKGWPAVVNAANNAFTAAHPGVGVNVTYLTWDQHLAALDAALTTGGAPDVTEMGNTEMTKYMAAGAFYPVPASAFDNSKTWLNALQQSATFGGKLYGVPYYASARAAIYRADYWRKSGIDHLPKSLAEFYADGLRIMKTYGKKDPTFSALYFPGQNWYAATSWVYDYGGSIAVQKNGVWKGNLSSPKSIAGLTELKKDVRALSRTGATSTEANEWTTFTQGHVASMLGSDWEVGLVITAPKVGAALAPVVGAFPMPSHVPGRTMPTFLRGSDLAVPASATHKSLGIDWIRYYTSTSSERRLASGSGVIPNTKTLLKTNDRKPLLAPFARAAASSWFVPTASHWADVEDAKVLQNMYVQIFTGRKSVKAAALSASKQITQILNTG